MKIIPFIIVIICSLGFLNESYCQECYDFYKTENCKTENAEKYKLSSMSRKHLLKLGSKVTYEVVFYGGEEIKIQCCTEDNFYPLRFKIRSSENGKIIYDNKYNNYLDNLNLLLDHTELMAIEISVEPKSKILRKYKNRNICVGMAIYMEDSQIKSNNKSNKI